MSRNPHVIARPTIVLLLADELEPRRVQRTAQSLFQERSLPALERVFDALVPKGEIYRFERLDIDLGRITEDELEEAFSAELPLRIGRMLERRVSATLSGMSGIVDRDTRSGAGGESAAEPEPPALKLEGSQTLMELLLYFLEKGVLPWWGSARFEPREDLDSGSEATSIGALEVGIEMAEAYATSSIFRQALLSSYRSRPRRVLGRLSVERWLRPLADQVRATAPEVRETSEAQPAVDSPLVAGLYHGANATPPETTSSASPLVEAEESPASEGAEQATAPETESPASPVVGTEQSPVREEVEQAAPPETTSPASSVVETDESAVSEDVDEAATDDSIYVRDAGLVLLHPFLLLLFQELDLLEEGTLTNETGRARAVRVLKYLAWGNTGRPEFELALEKFLCGVSIEEPLGYVELGPDDHEEADTVLRSTISHWSALKSTSETGLREGFLQREGKLTPGGERYTLRVQQQSHDVLLARLPWAISIVKLPWMDRPLAVEWT